MSATGSILSNDGALMALNSLRQSGYTTNNLEAQLSSGKSINSPADNPAGYITAEGFTAQINGIAQAISNANQGVALLQTAEGALNQQNDILQQMNSIAVQAANGTQTPSEAQSLQDVVSQLTSQVNTIAEQSQFNNINLLDGSFNGVSFQVGANNGQTISLSIAGTKADTIGMYSSKGSTTYGSALASGGVLTSSTLASASATPVAATFGKFATGNVTINGSNGTNTVSVTSKSESAASIAQSVNQMTSTTNVAAQAKTSMGFTLGAGAASSNFSFTLGNGSGAAATDTVNITAVGTNALVDAINANTATTGITAQIGSSGKLVMTQSQGENITITNMTAGKLGTLSGNASAPVYAEIQGQVQLQSDAGFNVGSGSKIGLNATSNLEALSNINVSTLTGAEKAINVIKYALQGLGSEGGQLGATQQRLQADINNLNTTNQNLTSARSVVQDANIPQVSQQLTEEQVLQQAGVSALRASTSLQQLYQRLLP